MNKSALAIVFAAATLPLTFAAQTPATPAPAKDHPAAATTTKKPVKKHVKHVTKKSVTKSTTAPAPVSK